MISHAQGAYSVVRSGMKLSFRTSAASLPPVRPPPGLRHSRSSVAVHSTPSLPPPLPRGAGPFFARIACARPPAFAPARFARLIARASQAQGAHLPSVPLGFFRAGAKQETKRPADAASSLSHSTMLFRASSRNKELIQILFTHPRTQLQASGGSLDRLPRLLDMNAPGAGLADGNADRKGPAHVVLRQVDAALVIDRMQQPLVQLVDR